MCAVIGTFIKNPTQEDFDLLHKIFLESQIRGLHATGLSYVKNDKVITEKYPLAASKYPFNFSHYVNEDGNLYLVGHCRYSTSDLEFNQPISNDNISVVHNGVITQEPPEQWKELYGYDCTTRNDTELLLHTIEAGKSPLVEWKDSSLGVCELHANKTLRFYRNGKRPLFLSSLENGGFVVTSTADISIRAGINPSRIQLLPYCFYYTADSSLEIEEDLVETDLPDLQSFWTECA